MLGNGVVARAGGENRKEGREQVSARGEEGGDEGWWRRHEASSHVSSATRVGGPKMTRTYLLRCMRHLEVERVRSSIRVRVRERVVGHGGLGVGDGGWWNGRSTKRKGGGNDARRRPLRAQLKLQASTFQHGRPQPEKREAVASSITMEAMAIIYDQQTRQRRRLYSVEQGQRGGDIAGKSATSPSLGNGQERA